MKIGRAGVLLLALALAACGGQRSGGGGTATLWITKDRGSQVVLTTTVAAGQTALQALAGEVEVKTRYGGRYVQAIEGTEGSISSRHDWFYYVNGVEADRGASDYRLRPGDVEWWDYRSWKQRLSVPVVVGAFPEPFLNGSGGRPAVVVGTGPGARALARLLHGRVAARAPAGANVLRLAGGPPRFTASRRGDGSFELLFAGDALRLARDPASVRFRYELP